MPHQTRTEWIAASMGLVFIIIVLCFCAIRIQRMSEVIARKEIEFHQILMIQQEVRDNQQQTIKILRQRLGDPLP